MYKNLREYISLLEKRGELVRVSVQVSTDEEIAEITDRISKTDKGGKAILFENNGTAFPVAMNLFGSDSRMAAALGVESYDDIQANIEKMAKKLMSPKSGLSDKLSTLPLLGKASRWFPKKSNRRGECQQVILRGEDAKLSLLPILKCWEHDGGRFITLPMVNTIDPETGIRNTGMYRMQIFDDYTTGMHWHIHKTGARHYDAYKKMGKRMPVSVCLGGDPAYTYSAIAPLPEGIDEYLLAGFLRNKPVKLVKCITNDIRVPSDCDFVIEGYVDPTEEKVVEGPFGDHTGFYSLEDYYPKFHVTAITHRHDAIYPATIVGIPPQEDLYMAKATEKIFLAPIKLVMQPEMTDMFMPAEGVAHNIAIININTRYKGQAAKVASSLWGAGQMMFCKYIIITSTDSDIRNPKTLARLLRNCDMRSCIIHGTGVYDVLDHATATPGTGGKLAIDLTNASLSEGLPFELPKDVKNAGNVENCDLSLFAEWGAVVLKSSPTAIVDAGKFIDENNLCNAKVAVIIDNAPIQLTAEEMLWIVSSNSDPTRDAVLHGGTLVIDGRTKPSSVAGSPVRFPNVVASSEKVIDLVDNRWEEYDLGEKIESPSKRYRKLHMSEKAQI